jgi:two-component system phosphate regulon sensor histidine kinase PhoR
METLSVHAVVRRVAEAMNVQVASRGGTMTVELDAARDVVLGDQIHLENVVHNVLENAVKYSPEAPSVRVRSRLDGTNVILSISDEGIGVEETYLDKVFEKYFRVPTGNIHDVKGFGLGLSYVKLIVEKHGGKVSMHSQPGVGTTITLQLPSI